MKYDSLGDNRSSLHSGLGVSLGLSLALVLITGCDSAAHKNEQTQAVQSSPAYHEQVRRILINDDAVKPAHPDIHPVRTVYNREAVIPPMCYTRTQGENNPCYVCHQDAISGRENVMNDADLQEAYSFSDLGMTNHWANLFEDRTEAVAKISDNAIIDWVNQDNYTELAPRLKAANFKGWIPDLDGLALSAEAFDEYGFAKDNSHWVAFNYKPFPSTFWPTNGSTDDVMIRLAEPYRQNDQGEFSLDVYRANLAILEAKIKGFNKISSLPVNEAVIGKDLNRDGQLSIVTDITDVSSYVGQASPYFIDDYLYPEGTEFLHTVRYLGFNDAGNVTLSTRMKEVRYMKKWKAYPKATLARYYEEEGYDKEAGHLPGYTLLGDNGLDNDMGWSLQSFIENRQGRLRTATHEENLFCMGCHGSIGSTIDKTFSFARKVDGTQGWRYIDLKNMPDAPTLGDSKGEIATYFERAGGGDEFRSNPEMMQRWFDENGKVDQQALLNKDVYDLITPSRGRALELNKAYKVITEQQSFLYGRDATVTPPQNVYHQVDNETAPTLAEDKIYPWDIRLSW